MTTERGHREGPWVALGRCCGSGCGRIEAAKEGLPEKNTGDTGVTETLVIAGPESSIEVAGLAKYPSHGGSQGFKSPHLHPHPDDQRKRWSSSGSGPVRVAA
jgi:hypothetical protein